MKKIEAIIRKSKFDEVVKALHDAEVYFFSYWDVTGVGNEKIGKVYRGISYSCLLYTSPSPRDRQKSRMPSSA